MPCLFVINYWLVHHQAACYPCYGVRPICSLHIFLFWWETFFVPAVLVGNSLFWTCKNWTESNKQHPTFWHHENCPPPMVAKIPISFQRRWLINSIIGNCQCTLRALTISNICFLCSFDHSYKKHYLQRGQCQLGPWKQPLARVPPFHTMTMVLGQCQCSCHHFPFLPCKSPPNTP